MIVIGIFQSTLLQEERHTDALTSTEDYLLSIHAPTRGATLKIMAQLIVQIFQSTLLQEERHTDALTSTEDYLLSIHAPTRGATDKSEFQAGWDPAFNPRSYKRSDINDFPYTDFHEFFQSTLLQEERRQHFQILNCQIIFQSTLLQEERHSSAFDNKWIMIFQSTLLQEERPVVLDCELKANSFNPRSYKRSDVAQHFFVCYHLLSIHAPTRGATSSR